MVHFSRKTRIARNEWEKREMGGKNTGGLFDGFMIDTLTVSAVLFPVANTAQTTAIFHVFAGEVYGRCVVDTKTTMFVSTFGA